VCVHVAADVVKNESVSSDSDRLQTLPHASEQLQRQEFFARLGLEHVATYQTSPGKSCEVLGDSHLSRDCRLSNVLYRFFVANLSHATLAISDSVHCNAGSLCLNVKL